MFAAASGVTDSMSTRRSSGRRYPRPSKSATAARASDEVVGAQELRLRSRGPRSSTIAFRRRFSKSRRAIATKVLMLTGMSSSQPRHGAVHCHPFVAQGIGCTGESSELPVRRATTGGTRCYTPPPLRPYPCRVFPSAPIRLKNL